MRKIYSFLIIFILLVAACSSPVELPEGIGYSFKKNILTIELPVGQYQLSALNQDIIKVAYSDSTVYGNRVYGPIINSNVATSLKTETDKLILSTQNVNVEVTFSPLKFSFYDKASGLKLQEEKGYNRRGDTTAFSYTLKEGEAIYGTGSRSIPQNRRGYKFRCFNQANYGYGENADFLNYSIPAFLSSEKYMVLIDNPARAWFDIGKSNADVLDFASMGGNMVYYFINGDSYKDILAKYGKLTGTQPLPPIWALGNLQSRFGYRSQEETESVVSGMIDAGYPIDAIIIDLYWFGEELQDGYMGNLSWDKRHWPEPEKMIRSFAEKGVKTITVSEPFFTRKSKNFNYLDEHKLLGLDSLGNTMTMPYFYFGDAGLIDIFKPESRAWFWQQYKKGKEQGIAGWWGDLGEPEVHPDDMVHVNGKAHEVHGVYGHEWVSMLYDNYAKDYPNERLFKLGRAGYAGSQRYGLLPWSGDVGRTWTGFRAQNNVMLGMSLSGLPYMHSDAGGFAWYPRDSILYMRWLQMAVFSPIFRPHADPKAPAEPIFYHQKVQDIVKKSIKLRYAMLPYNYTLAWKTEQTGMPLTRPLFFEFEDQNISDTVSDVYMWGQNLLVAPVFYPDAKTRSVYLPEGDWYDFYTSTYFKGGDFTEVKVEEETIPVFVHGGSFIPLAEYVQNTDVYKGDVLTIQCYLKESNNNFEDVIYFDDGKLKGAYSKGKYELLKMKCKEENGQLKVSFSVEGDGYEGAPENRSIKLKVKGLSEAPKSITLNNSEIPFTWENDLVVIKDLNTSAESEIIIK